MLNIQNIYHSSLPFTHRNWFKKLLKLLISRVLWTGMDGWMDVERKSDRFLKLFKIYILRTFWSPDEFGRPIFFSPLVG